MEMTCNLMGAINANFNAMRNVQSASKVFVRFVFQATI